MNRAVAGLFVVLTLGVGLLVGALAGDLLAAPNASPIALAAATAPPSLAPSPAETGPNAGSAIPGPTSAPTASASPTPSPTPVTVPAPLTGLPISKALAARHVIAVMVDDQFEARPQSGFNDAGVVWQAPAEGGIPRYMLLFQDGNPPAVGPVRSSRLYFIAWAAEWKAVYVHVGGSPQALALLNSSQGRGKVVYNADEFRWGGRYLWRIKTRNAPHNVYSNATSIRALVTVVGAKPVTAQAPVWKFAPDAGIPDRPQGGTIVVPYLANRITYAYDRVTNRYFRTVSGEGKQFDAGTKSRVGPKNVIVVVMSFAPLNDGTQKHRLEAQFTGSGVAYIATNGKTVKGTWKKKSLTAPTLFYGPNGKPVTLTAGQTFVQVVPRGTTITIRDGKVPPIPPVVFGHGGPGGPAPQ